MLNNQANPVIKERRHAVRAYRSRSWQIRPIPKGTGDIVYKAMVDVINVPENDKFQVITEHAPEELNLAESYMGNRYSNVILIQITLSAGRSIDLKKAFYKRIVDDLHDQLEMRREDVVINLVEVAKENWSFGGGIAQYVT
jgi:phenylpyruvate tautomerase PptA (4-oxalocrotonate tautomerase family)